MSTERNEKTDSLLDRCIEYEFYFAKTLSDVVCFPSTYDSEYEHLKFFTYANIHYPSWPALEEIKG